MFLSPGSRARPKLRIDDDLSFLGISATVANNLLTVSVYPATNGGTALAFRDPTQSNGPVIFRRIPPVKINTFATGATLGSANNSAFRFWVLLFDNSGAIVPALYNASSSGNVYPINEAAPLSTTGISSGATSAGTAYTPNGISLTSKSFRIVGYIEYNSTGLATAGTYATAPNFVRMFGPGVKKPGDIVQSQRSASGAVATGTTILPFDDTIPQNTEGDQYFSQSITPTSAVNILWVRSELDGSTSGTGTIIAALFQDTTANALATAYVYQDTAATTRRLTLDYKFQAATISATTLKVRAGVPIANTLTINGQGAARQFGGTSNSFLNIDEIMG